VEFGKWLAQRRREGKFTLRQLAKKSNLSLPYVAALERGTSEPPPLRTCRALARALGMSWEAVWEQSFRGRLEKWLAREGYRTIREEELLEFLSKIRATQHRPSK
jgi:transcriptional regulator with XRE-family HTH domain